MDFIQTSNKQVDKFGSGKHGFSAGNPTGGIPATYMSSEWCDNIQQEVVNVIEGAGGTVNPASKTQLYQAIQAMIAGGAANDYKASVRFTTTGNIVLSGLGTQAGGDWGAALTAGDRILPKEQTAGADRTIWIAAAGAWTRATDADGVGELTSGALVTVEEGTTLADSIWEVSTDGPITPGVTPLTWARKDAGAALGMASGAVAHFAMNTAPTGWLKANGAAVSRTTYAALFAAIGTTFGVGDGGTTFNLPDLRGEFIRSWDDARGVDSGRAIGTAQAQDTQPHVHAAPSGYQFSLYAGVSGGGSLNGAGSNFAYSTNTASFGTTETRPRNVSLLACIKY